MVRAEMLNGARIRCADVLRNDVVVKELTSRSHRLPLTIPTITPLAHDLRSDIGIGVFSRTKGRAC
ncbi:MAG: hypothetical protein ACI9OJ_002875 [Myxococcota bacterium]|jgi:hypothetical protein